MLTTKRNESAILNYAHVLLVGNTRYSSRHAIYVELHKQARKTYIAPFLSQQGDGFSSYTHLSRIPLSNNCAPTSVAPVTSSIAVAALHHLCPPLSHTFYIATTNALALSPLYTLIYTHTTFWVRIGEITDSTVVVRSMSATYGCLVAKPCV